MKIATWNVNGIRAREAQFLELVLREEPDVVCLQEIKATPDQISEALSGLPGYHAFWHGAPKGYSGVSLHVKKGLCLDGEGEGEGETHAPRFEHPSFDRESRLVHAKVGETIFASVYIPNGGKDFVAKMEFMTAMRGWVEGIHASGTELVLCGDMNVALTDADVHPKERKPGIIGQRGDERALMATWLSSGRLHDLGRELEPTNDRLFTWWPYWREARKRNIGWRLDYFFISAKWRARATACRVLNEFGASDHAPVIATFDDGAY
jgi:exodeoxyribonuclease-3